MCVYKIEEIAERVRPIAERYGVGKIYLFGSYARGEATEESDIDLLVDAENIRGLEFYGLWSDLENALKKSLDLVTTRSVYKQDQDDSLSIKFRNAVDKDRRIIYDK